MQISKYREKILSVDGKNLRRPDNIFMPNSALRSVNQVHSDRVLKNLKQRYREGVGIYAVFKNPEKPVEVRIGISYIDEEQAAGTLKKKQQTKV